MRAAEKIKLLPGASIPSSLRLVVGPPGNFRPKGVAYGARDDEVSHLRALDIQTVEYSTEVGGAVLKCNMVKPLARHFPAYMNNSGVTTYEMQFNAEGRVSRVHLQSSSSDTDADNAAILAAYTTICTPADAKKALLDKPWKTIQRTIFIEVIEGGIKVDAQVATKLRQVQISVLPQRRVRKTGSPARVSAYAASHPTLVKRAALRRTVGAVSLRPYPKDHRRSDDSNGQFQRVPSIDLPAPSKRNRASWPNRNLRCYRPARPAD